MFEKFLSGNVESFRQRYEGTYGFFRDDKKNRTLVRLDSISETRCDFLDADGLNYHINADTAEEMGFEFIPPKSSWYNTPDFGAVFTQRRAQRQFSRGIHSGNLAMFALTSGVTANLGVDFVSLSQIYEKAIPPRQALEKWKEGTSIAISGQFALSSGNVFLFLDNVGTYKRSGSHFLFKLREPRLWKTEITDALTSLGQTLEIA